MTSILSGDLGAQELWPVLAPPIDLSDETEYAAAADPSGLESQVTNPTPQGEGP